jgi:RND family efflux transporter MFP subunit
MVSFFVPLVALAGCARREEAERPLTAVRVEAVAAPPASAGVPYSGVVQAQTQVDLAFKVGGYVRAVAEVTDGVGKRRLLQAGDRVRWGAVLASVRESDYQSRLAELRGMRDDTRAAVAKARLDLERAGTLREQKVIPQAELDGIQARLDSLLGAASAADARVSQASIALGDTQIRAPLDGIVLARAVEVGALVAPGSPGFVLADTSSVKVVFGAPDRMIQGLAIGGRVAVTTESLPGRVFAGTITRLAAQADPRTRVFDVEATVENADQSLKVGMIEAATVDAPAAARPAVALLPLSAVVRPAGREGFAVFVANAEGEGSVTRLRSVQLGDLVASRVAITAGVAPGDRVVIQGASLVADGQHVVVVP